MKVSVSLAEQTCYRTFMVEWCIFCLRLVEFCPGVPWKGLQNIDPENDPNMTPGSVPSGPTINTNIQDVHRYLQRDRSGGEGGNVARLSGLGWLSVGKNG